MIIEPTHVTQNNVTFNRLAYDQPFYAVGYGADKVVRLITSEDEILEAGTIISGKLQGFGSTTFAELIEECERRNLKELDKMLNQ